MAFVRSKSGQDMEASLAEKKFRYKFYKLNKEKKEEIYNEQKRNIDDYFVKALHEASLASIKYY